MSNIDERLSTLEANDKTLFHQVDELKEDIRDIRRLTIAVEKIASKVDNIDYKVNGIDERLQTVEHVPVTNWNKFKQAIISSIVSVIVGGLLGALIALVIK